MAFKFKKGVKDVAKIKRNADGDGVDVPFVEIACDSQEQAVEFQQTLYENGIECDCQSRGYGRQNFLPKILIDSDVSAESVRAMLTSETEAQATFGIQRKEEPGDVNRRKRVPAFAGFSKGCFDRHPEGVVELVCGDMLANAEKVLVHDSSRLIQVARTDARR